MLFKNILVLADGTVASEKVVRFICSNQRSEPIEIHVVHVVEVPRSMPMDQCPPNLMAFAKETIEKVQAIAAECDATIMTRIIYARTLEDAVLTTAADLDCDLIAVAQNNQKLRLIANVAQNIYQRAKCSVCLMNVK